VSVHWGLWPEGWPHAVADLATIAVTTDVDKVDCAPCLRGLRELRRIALEAVPLEGTIIEPVSRAAGMVEATTEYDFDELPVRLQVQLEQWCEGFDEWIREKNR
jgi:hypothetical protein